MIDIHSIFIHSLFFPTTFFVIRKICYSVKVFYSLKEVKIAICITGNPL